MTSLNPVPPLPQPQPPAQAAQALAEAAQAAAGAWAQPLDPDRRACATRQLSSTLRDIGIAARRLAAWQPADGTPRPSGDEFSSHVTCAADRLLSTWNGLDVRAAEGTGQPPDPTEPGTALCQAARGTIRAWRQPTGTRAERDAAMGQLIIAVRSLSAATLGLASHAPPSQATSFRAASAGLAEVTAELTAAATEPFGNSCLISRTERPQPGAAD